MNGLTSFILSNLFHIQTSPKFLLKGLCAIRYSNNCAKPPLNFKKIDHPQKKAFHKSLPHENLKAQASEMPHHAKHHASENRKAIERSLVIAMHTQHEPRRGSVMIVKKEKRGL